MVVTTTQAGIGLKKIVVTYFMQKLHNTAALKHLFFLEDNIKASLIPLNSAIAAGKQAF